MSTNLNTYGVFGNQPLAQVTPFTYREGATLLRIMESFKDWAVRFGPEVQKILNEAFEEFDKTYAESLVEWQGKFDAFLADAYAIIEEYAEQAAVVAVDDYLADPTTIDNAVALKIKEIESATRKTLDGIYANLDDFKELRYDFTQFKAAIEATLDAIEYPYIYVTTITESALQDALYQCRDAGGGTLELVHGATYDLREKNLEIYENTTIRGNGATLLRHHDSYMLINGERGSEQNGYNNNGNISLYDLNLDQNGANVYKTASIICFAHGHHFHFERVRFLNTTSHAYEMNSSRYVTVLDCEFLGYVAVQSTPKVEAIQLDISTPAGQFAFVGGDMTPCRDVLIKGCVFDGYRGLPPQPRSIGGHKTRIDSPHTNVTIDGCTFSGDAEWSIVGWHWNDVNIVNNFSSGPKGFLQIVAPPVGGDDSKTADGHQTNASKRTVGYRVHSNTIKTDQGVQFIGQPTGEVSYCQITDNRFYGNDFDDMYAMSGRYFTNSTVSGNSFNNYESGVYFRSMNGDMCINAVVIEGNSVYNCRVFGVYVSGGANIMVTGNSLRNNGFKANAGAENGAHIRFSGDSVNMGANSNVCSATGSTKKADYALYASGSVENVIHVGNMFAGASVNGVEDLSSGSYTGKDFV